MLPSNISPTSLPPVSISGLPELPPTMSLLVERSNLVCGSSSVFTLSQLSGIRNGSWPVARSNSRDRYVNGSISRPSSFQPCTEPTFRRRVKVASGGTLVPYTRKRSEEHTSELQSHSDLVC